MNSRLSHDDRDDDIAEKTAAHVVAIRAKVKAAEPPIALIADGMTDLLCDAELMEGFACAALAFPALVGAVLAFLTENVIADQAEVEAIKEVEIEEASITPKDRLRIERDQRRAEISAAYCSNPPMYERIA
jgi:hypothetical protein